MVFGKKPVVSSNLSTGEGRRNKPLTAAGKKAYAAKARRAAVAIQAEAARQAKATAKARRRTGR